MEPPAKAVEPPKPVEPAKPVEPPKPPPEPPKPPPEPPPAPAAGTVGVVQGVHPEYGIFIKLDAGAKVAAGDVLEVMRKGQAVGRLKVERVTGVEKLYPNGCAVCKVDQGEPATGDSVRRAAK